MFGTILLGINPIATFILCMVPRILMGWLTGLIFIRLKKSRKLKSISYAVTCLVCPLLNTIFFMSLLIVFFGNSSFLQELKGSMGADTVIGFIIALVGVNGLIETGLCFILGTVVSKTLDIVLSKTRA